MIRALGARIVAITLTSSLAFAQDSFGAAGGNQGPWTAPQPGGVMPQPGGTGQQPGWGMPQPGGTMPQQPGGAMQQPGWGLQQPGGSMQQPGWGVQPPGGVMQEPGAPAPQQGWGMPQPGGMMPQQPDGPMQRPGWGVEQPGAVMPQPSPSTPQPGGGTQAGGMMRPSGGAIPPPAGAPGGTEASERADYGVPPTDQLHNGAMHGPTPTSVPGGQLITTQGLVPLIMNQGGQTLILDVLGGPQGLPGAIPAVRAAQGGSFQDQTQQEFAQFLQSATQGRKDVPIVTYCLSTQCWMSYNAALRAINLGYTNVLWYRGGVEAWGANGGPFIPLQ